MPQNIAVNSASEEPLGWFVPEDVLSAIAPPS
jgi:hypothetical protein